MIANRAGEKFPLKATVTFGIQYFSRYVVNVDATVRRCRRVIASAETIDRPSRTDSPAERLKKSHV